MGEGRSGGRARSWVEVLGKTPEISRNENCRSRVNHIPRRWEALAPGIFSLERSFAYPRLPQRSGARAEEERKPVVMEMPVAPRSARALGSPQTLFRFRRFGSDTVDFTLPPEFLPMEPTNGVTGPGSGAIDRREETEGCCRRG